MKSNTYLGHLAMLTANILWGCMSPSSKIVLSSGMVNAISLTTFRMLGAAIVVLGGTFFAYLLVPIGQRLLRPTVATMYNYVQPIVASCIAIIVRLDSFGIMKSFAIALVFLGVYIVTQSKSKAQIEAYKKEEIERYTFFNQSKN